MGPDMRIAAVIVTHNRPQLLQQALAALRAQTRPLDSIYIVDNASDDPAAAGATRLAGNTAIVVVRSDTNIGGAGGFALGMAKAFAAGHDWIWLLDDDAIARPDALARLLDAVPALSCADEVAGMPGLHQRAPPARPGALCGAVREFGDLALRHRRRYHRPTGLERPIPREAYAGPPCRVDTASFAGFLVSAAAVAEAGLPERGFFLGYDDTEYSLRLGRAGLAIWLVPGSVVEHLRERQARLRAGPFGPKHYFTIRNRIAVARRYASLPIVPSCVALAFGAAAWIVSRGRLRRGALRILWRAVADGCKGRLGPYPEALARPGMPAQAKVQEKVPPPPARSGSSP